MDRSIYSPGAGHQPPLMVGREREQLRWQRMLAELDFRGRVGAEDLVVAGHRGVGKTVLMGRFVEIARSAGHEVLTYQPAGRAVGLVDSILEQAADRLDDQVGVWQKVRRSFERVAGVSLGAAGVSASLSLRQAPAGSTARDGRVVARALADLADAVRSERPAGGVVLAVDELQAAADTDLTLLAVALHRLNTEFPQARVGFVATALPTIYTVLEDAGVTHPDRLFPTLTVPGTLPAEAAYAAIVTPATSAGVSWEPAAADAVVEASGGYPAHLQLMAGRTWEIAEHPTIRLVDARQGIAAATEQVRLAGFDTTWERLPDFQRNYLVALAAHGGHTSTRTIVEALGKRTASELSEARDALIKAGVIYAPRRGEVSFTAPTTAAFVLEQTGIDAAGLQAGRASFPPGLPTSNRPVEPGGRDLSPDPEAGRATDRGPDK